MCYIQDSFIFSFQPLKIGLIVFTFSFESKRGKK